MLVGIGVIIFLFVDYELYITYCTKSGSSKDHSDDNTTHHYEQVELTLADDVKDDVKSHSNSVYGSTNDLNQAEEESKWGSMLDSSKWYTYISHNISLALSPSTYYEREENGAS